MENNEPLLSIGELARRTGLPVRTIRFWSDAGVLPPAARAEGGRRLYDAACVAQVELVATLRELGLGLADSAEAAKVVNRILEPYGWSASRGTARRAREAVRSAGRTILAAHGDH